MSQPNERGFKLSSSVVVVRDLQLRKKDNRENNGLTVYGITTNDDYRLRLSELDSDNARLPKLDYCYFPQYQQRHK